MAVYEIDLSTDGPQVQAALLEMIKQRTVPNVWIKGQHIGGFDDTSDLASTGELHRRLPLDARSLARRRAQAHGLGARLPRRVRGLLMPT